MLQISAADLDGPVDQVSQRSDHARLQGTPGNQQERHREHHRHQGDDRCPLRPSRTRRVEFPPARLDDGVDDLECALQLAEHPRLVRGIEKLHASRLRDLVGIDEHLLHFVEHHRVGVLEVLDGCAFAVVMHQPMEVREPIGDLAPVSRVHEQHGRVLGESGVDDLVKLAIHVAPDSCGQTGERLDARRLLRGLGPEPGPQPAQGRRPQNEDEERGLVEQQKALEGAGSKLAHRQPRRSLQTGLVQCSADADIVPGPPEMPKLVDMHQINGSIWTTRPRMHGAGAARGARSAGNLLPAGNLLNDLTVTASGSRAQNWHAYCMYLGAPVQSAPTGKSKSIIVPEEVIMWTKPDFTEMRFGFEITMYIGNR